MSSGHFNVHICHSDLVGRPRFEISPQQLLFLVESQFTVTQMADILGVSTRTVRKRMEEYDISISTQYSRMTDLELDIIVGEIQAQFPTCGNRQMQGHLLSMGYRIPQHRVRESQRRVDPNGVIARRLHVINRRQYYVPAPHANGWLP